MRDLITITMVLSFVGTTALPIAGSGTSTEGGEDRGPGFLDTGLFWTDSLDDLSHVYVPPSGLVGVTVTGGQAQLKAGASEGWIASSLIKTRDGFRFDYVLLEAETPGASKVQISILNATAEASEVGFANETIGGFRKVEGTDLLVYSIPPDVYPILRIQVNLVADGNDRPALKAWSMYYVAMYEWRDEFLGTGKMAEVAGLNLTGGKLEINMSGKSASSGPVDYQPYPPIVVAGYDTPLLAMYRNEAGDGYGGMLTLDSNNYHTLAIDDYDGDGNLDLATAARGSLCKVMWGTGDGRFTTTGLTTLNCPDGRSVGAGDFNGDGLVDLAYASNAASGIGDSMIFLNDDGDFDAEPDIVFTDEEYDDVAIGDVNNDGFDDVCFYEWPSLVIYYGGMDGPDKTPDFTLSPDTCRDVLIDDLDLDGYPDLLVTESPTAKPDLYLGGVDGPDTTIDQSFTVTGVVVYGAKSGDVNGDGYIDLVFLLYESSEYKFKYFPGSATGWSDSTMIVGPSVEYGDFTVGDVDKDGYDDIVISCDDGGTGHETKVFRGGNTFPTTAAIQRATGGKSDVAIAIPKASRLQAFRGTFTTVPITKNHDMRWDIVAIRGSVPKNTSVSITVLDDQGKVAQGLFDQVGIDLDLRGRGLPDTISVRVKVTSELNDTTPVLDRLIVKWMEPNAWRDEFYGPAKVDRTVGLYVGEGVLGEVPGEGLGPPLIVTSLRSDEGFQTGSQVYRDAGGLDYLARTPDAFETRGASAVARADLNGDGLVDLVFARRQSGDGSFDARSPVYLGTPVGFKTSPDLHFPTVGASAVVVEDLDGDGHADVVFSQELRGQDDHSVNSTLFWGSADGWAATPDVEFVTRGASDVEAADLDGDGLLDLAFACYKDSSTATDSMVFLQSAAGFDGSSPDHRLPTQGARGVASGDLDGDGLVDLVFANSFSGGFAEIDSFAYMGASGGGFEATPGRLPTKGATDVAVADVDGDGDADLVFANRMDNNLNHTVASFVYLNDGSGDFGDAPAASLPTTGACAVAVADLDGTGWKDLVFACLEDGSSYDVPSLVYLGGASGYGTTADMALPTVGASDVEVGELARPGSGGYLSRPVVVEDPRGTGSFHTLKYEAVMGPSHTARVMLVDATTWEVLAETSLQAGRQEWVVEGAFRFKEHPSVRVMITSEGLEGTGTFYVDDLWLNWTPRVQRPPRVVGMGVSEPHVYRLGTVDLWLNVTDEYDPVEDLVITVQHRLNGTEGPWETFLLGSREPGDDLVTIIVRPRVGAPTGRYDFRAHVVDSDGRESGVVLFPALLEVRNNLPTAPEVRIAPDPARTTSSLRVELVTSASDLESAGVTYRYRWLRDGVLEANATEETLSGFYTSRGENWTVEVRAFDGEDEGPPGIAWVVIENAPPSPRNDLPDPDMDEDTVEDEWINLRDAFEDADGDPLAWSVAEQPEHILVTIDHATGRVTFEPDTDWFGQAQVTFLASDGEHTAQQTVTVTVHPVNDLPWFVSVDGEPVTGPRVEYVIDQGEELVIRYVVADVEGDPVVADVSTTAVSHDEAAGTITFKPGSDEVGTLTFTLRIHDTESPGERVTLEFSITVRDVNDPMDDPRITSPAPGESFKVNQSFTLIAICTDPDVPFGQVLNFTWESNVSGLLGHGSSLLLSLQDPGWHLITLTVRDPDYSKTDTIEVLIKPGSEVGPPPPPDDDDTPTAFKWAPWVLLLVVLVAVVVSVYVLGTKRRTEELEEADDEEFRREQMTQALNAVKDAADSLEADRDRSREGDEWEETGAGTVEVVSPELQLSMRATVTEEASADTTRLWEGVNEATEGQAADREALRIDNMKRQYQNAIGRLPYGIPSKELQGRDWVDLANALATGEKRTVEQGKEVTNIDGRWYYSDHEDTGTFLKEHGAKQGKEASRGAAEKGTLLAKLEERFIMGEISEETFKELKEKYGGG